MKYSIRRLDRLSSTYLRKTANLFRRNFFNVVSINLFNHDVLEKILLAALKPKQIYVCISENYDVAGLIAFSNNKERALNITQPLLNKSLGTLLGTFLFPMANNSFNVPCVSNSNECYIDFLCVDSNHRKRGIATTLLSHLYSQTNYEHYVLHVKQDNVTAFKLYEKLGYNVVNIKEDTFLNLSGHGHSIVMKYSRSNKQI